MGDHKCGFPQAEKMLADAGAIELAAMRQIRPPWRLQWNRLNALGRLARGIRCRVSNPDRISDAPDGDLIERLMAGTSGASVKRVAMREPRIIAAILASIRSIGRVCRDECLYVLENLAHTFGQCFFAQWRVGLFG